MQEEETAYPAKATIKVVVRLFCKSQNELIMIHFDF